MNDEEMGKAAFEAYTEDMHGMTLDDRPIPPWDDLGEKVQSAWISAAKKVEDMRVDYGPQRWHTETQGGDGA